MVVEEIKRDLDELPRFPQPDIESNPDFRRREKPRREKPRRDRVSENYST